MLAERKAAVIACLYDFALNDFAQVRTPLALEDAVPSCCERATSQGNGKIMEGKIIKNNSSVLELAASALGRIWGPSSLSGICCVQLGFWLLVNSSRLRQKEGSTKVRCAQN